MPKRHKNKTKRRTRRSGNRKGATNHFTGQFVPARQRVSMRLNGQVENAASGTYAEAGFTINDMFDPQGGSGASQCPGYDQMALLYNRYRVHASKLKLRLSLNSTSATPTSTALYADVVVYPSMVTTGAATINDGCSQPFAKQLIVSGEKPVNITEVCKVSKFIGNTLNADRLQALVTASPADRLFWHVGIISRAYTTVSYTMSVEITYDVEFFERSELDRSSLTLLHECRMKILEEKKSKPEIPFVNTTTKPQVLIEEDSKYVAGTPRPALESKENYVLVKRSELLSTRKS